MDPPTRVDKSEDRKLESTDIEEDFVTSKVTAKVNTDEITEFLSLFSSPARTNVYYCNIQNVIMDAQYVLVDGDSLLVRFSAAVFNLFPLYQFSYFCGPPPINCNTKFRVL